MAAGSRIKSLKKGSWSTIAPFVEAGVALRLARTEKALSLATTLDSSFKSVGAFEPFFVDFSQNPSFAKAREEAYSDYLAWLLEQMGNHGAWLCGLLKINDPLVGRACIGKPVVKREVPVIEGHEGQSGRMDILVLFESVLIDIEVKTVDAESADLGKNKGYRTSLQRMIPSEKYPYRFHRLLVTSALRGQYNDEEDCGDGPYVAILWRDLCLAMRSLVKSGAFLENRGLASLALSFVGSVEQILLGYRSLGGKPLNVDGGTLEYLENMTLSLAKRGGSQ